MNFPHRKTPSPRSLMNQDPNQKYGQQYNFPFVEGINKYRDIVKIGEGTFGEVFKARNKYTQQIVAMKMIRVNRASKALSIMAIREIAILQRVNHENMIHLIEICKYHADFFLIMDFCDHDLAAFLSNKNVTFKLEEIKTMLKMLLSGLFYLHFNKVLHRDLKPANILLTRNGILKLADFGLARPFSTSTAAKRNCMSTKVATLWYRAPELLLGERDYGPPIDMWSVGCIMGEFWIRHPLMAGTSEQGQLNMITRLCGSINPSVWPDVTRLPLFNVVKLPQCGYDWKVYADLWHCINNAEAFDLLYQLLCLDPSKRISAYTALYHYFFRTNPLPCDLRAMMSRDNDRPNLTLFVNRSP